MEPTSVPEDQARRAPANRDEFAGALNYTLTGPELTDAAIAEGCRLALELRVGMLTVRGSDIDYTARQLEGSGVVCAGVVGQAGGASTTPAKLYETKDLLRRGARSIEVVLNTGKLRSRQFQYVEMELMQLSKAAHEAGGKLTAVLEMALLAEDVKLIALKICKRAEADVVKGAGATEADAALMKRVLKDVCGMETEAGGGVEAALESYAQGAVRLSTGAAAGLMGEFEAREKALAGAAEPTGAGG